jgi:rare lipoprotein A
MAHSARWAMAALLALAMVGCANGPLRSLERDGAETNPPPDLVRVPDAEPTLEPIRQGGPNKPYDALGHTYVPITQDAPFTERGIASWYGKKFHGRRTASGEVYNMYAMTAAHPTLPIPSYARIRNPANGREIVVRINDRGPFHGGRILDLSYTAALKLDVLRGVGAVEVQRITFDEIRTGAWRRPLDADAVRVATSGNTNSVANGGSNANPPAAGAGNGSVTSAIPVIPIAAGVIDTSTATATAINVNGNVAPLRATASTASDPQDSTRAAVSPPSVSAALPTPAAAPTAGSSEPVADAPAARAYTSAARGYWVQLGAFRVREGAESFHKRVADDLDWLSPLLAVFNDSSMFRLQAGPYPSREEARGVAQRVRDGLQLVPVIVERR